MSELKSLLLVAPDSQLDASVKPLIESWSSPPTPLELLEVIDLCVHASLATGFVVTVLQNEYETACKRENVTHEDVLKFAHWRWIFLVIDGSIDPVCTIHGLRFSKHDCLYCCLCFKDLVPAECHELEDGTREDMCNPCAEAEKIEMTRRGMR